MAKRAPALQLTIVMKQVYPYPSPPVSYKETKQSERLVVYPRGKERKGGLEGGWDCGDWTKGAPSSKLDTKEQLQLTIVMKRVYP